MAEQAVEPDVIETPEPDPQEETGGGGSLALAVYEATPGSEIRSNIESIIEQVENLLAEVGDWDLDTPQHYRDMKATRTEIRKVKTAIENERKRLKDEYTRPLRAFEEQVKRATGPLDEADRRFKQKLDDYEAREAQERRRFLRDYYEELAPDFAELVPFDRFLELRGDRGGRGKKGDLIWLRRTVNEIKARDEMEAALAEVVKEWTALGAYCQNEDERVRIKSYYAESLDVAAALTRLKADRDREEEIRRQEEAEAKWRAEMAAQQAQAEAEREEAERSQQTLADVQSSQSAPQPPAEPPAPAQPEDEPLQRWHVVLDAHIEATRSQVIALAQLLKANGLTGGQIQKEA